MGLRSDEEPSEGDVDHTTGSDVGARLLEALGSTTIAELSRRSGVGYSVIRKYLGGAMPGLDKASALARALDVRLDWLATGEGPMRPESDEGGMPERVDTVLLESCIDLVERAQETAAALGRGWDAALRASMAARIYDIYRAGRPEEATRAILDALRKLQKG